MRILSLRILVCLVTTVTTSYHHLPVSPPMSPPPSPPQPHHSPPLVMLVPALPPAPATWDDWLSSLKRMLSGRHYLGVLTS